MKKECKCEAIHEFGHEKDCPMNKKNKEIEYIKDLIGNYESDRNSYKQNMRYINEIAHTFTDMEEEIEVGIMFTKKYEYAKLKLDKIEEVVKEMEIGEPYTFTPLHIYVKRLQQIIGDD
jgi:hypothetical protein